MKHIILEDGSYINLSDSQAKKYRKKQEQKAKKVNKDGRKSR